MTVVEYKELVKQLFRSGNATEGQWEEMATQVLYASETSCDRVPLIDKAIGIDELE